MITFRCKCGNGIQVPDEYAGKQARCRKCGHVVAIPTSPVAVPATPNLIARSIADRNSDQEQASGWSLNAKIAVGVSGAVITIAIGFFVWFFLIRDTWERDHGAEVVRLSEESTSLIKDQQSAEGVKKYDQLLRLIGSRKLNDPDVAKAATNARDVAEPIKQKIEEERVLSEKRRKDITAAKQAEDERLQAEEHRKQEEAETARLKANWVRSHGNGPLASGSDEKLANFYDNMARATGDDPVGRGVKKR